MSALPMVAHTRYRARCSTRRSHVNHATPGREAAWRPRAPEAQARAAKISGSGARPGLVICAKTGREITHPLVTGVVVPRG